MSQTKPSADELRAAAESATTARAAATAAKKAADDAGGVDDDLNKASQDAEQKAKDAEAHAEALSQAAKPDTKKVDKLLRKKHFIDKELKDMGVSDDEDDDDEDDPDAPVTRGDLARKTVDDLIAAIDNQDEQTAVRNALAQVNPDLIVSNPREAFTAAQGIAFRVKNSKILEEVNRKGTQGQRPRGAGAPPKKEDDVFEPTTEEQKYMRPPFSLSEADIKAARARGEKLG